MLDICKDSTLKHYIKRVEPVKCPIPKYEISQSRSNRSKRDVPLKLDLLSKQSLNHLEKFRIRNLWKHVVNMVKNEIPIKLANLKVYKKYFESTQNILNFRICSKLVECVQSILNKQIDHAFYTTCISFWIPRIKTSHFYWHQFWNKNNGENICHWNYFQIPRALSELPVNWPHLTCVKSP